MDRVNVHRAIATLHSFRFSKTFLRPVHGVLGLLSDNWNDIARCGAHLWFSLTARVVARRMSYPFSSVRMSG
jgi:hypothetical protein